MQDNKPGFIPNEVPYETIAKQLKTEANNTAILTAILRLQFRVEQAERDKEPTDTAVKEGLIAQIGSLYQRNVSLTKGHATLTSRVQELEAQLSEAQQQILANSSGDFAVVGGKTYIKETVVQDAVISKAQHDLQQFVNEEVKRQIVAAIKTGGTLNGR